MNSSDFTSYRSSVSISVTCSAGTNLGTTRPPGGTTSLVAPHPVPRRQKERGIVHEVEHIIEPMARIGRRSTVQLRLHRNTRAQAGVVSAGHALGGAEHPYSPV